MKRHKNILLIAFSLLLKSASANAQTAVLEKILSSIEDISVFYLPAIGQTGKSIIDKGSDRGFGFEISIGLTQNTEAKQETLEVLNTKKFQLPNKPKDLQDSTIAIKSRPIKKPKEESQLVAFELAVGYSQLGFKTENQPHEIRGALKELPSLSLYASFNPEWSVSPYVGIRAGLIQLHALRAYDDSTRIVYSGQGSSFQGGVAVGIVGGVQGKLLLFVEYSYNYRDFPSLEWTPTKDNTLPQNLPRKLNLSGYLLSCGFQIPLSKD